MSAVDTPAVMVAATWNDPVAWSAVNAGATAVPSMADVATACLVPSANVPDGDGSGAVKVTGSPGLGLEKLSVTRAVSATGYTVPTAAPCGVPAKAWISETGPAMFSQSIGVPGMAGWSSRVNRVCHRPACVEARIGPHWRLPPPSVTPEKLQGVLEPGKVAFGGSRGRV